MPTNKPLPEIVAMGKIVQALAELDPEELERVLRWLDSRYSITAIAGRQSRVDTPYEYAS